MFPIGIRCRTLTLLTPIVLVLSLSASTAMAAKVRTSSPAPRPAVSAAVRVRLGQILTFHKMRVTVPDRPIRIAGVVHPYQPGQWLSVRMVQGSRVLRERVVRLKRRSGGTGYFVVHLHSP